MMKIKMPITWPFLKLGVPDFVWQQFQIIPTDDANVFGYVNVDVDSDDNVDDNDDDDEHDAEDHYRHNSANFQARSFIIIIINIICYLAQ